jgi:hypothetical protein
MLNSIRDAVAQILPHRRKTNSSSGWISFNAPCCPHNGESTDTRGRGGLVMNPDGGVSYHCFNCNFKASYVPGRHLTYKFRKLLSWLGADEGTIKRLVIDAVRVKELIAPEQVVEAQEAEPIDFRPRPLPEQAQSFHALGTFYELNQNQQVPSDWHNAVIYAARRLIDLTRYDFYWTPETQYNLHKRIIIPFTWKGNVIGYTARAIIDDIKPKYYNSHEPGYVFNVDQQRADSKFVIVCEGPFDAMSVMVWPRWETKSANNRPTSLTAWAREVVVVPDADSAGVRLVDSALEYGWSVSFPVWQETCKDINSAVEKYGKLFVLKSIIDAKQSNRLKIELLKKRLYN